MEPRICDYKFSLNDRISPCSDSRNPDCALIARGGALSFHSAPSRVTSLDILEYSLEILGRI